MARNYGQEAIDYNIESTQEAQRERRIRRRVRQRPLAGNRVNIGNVDYCISVAAVILVLFGVVMVYSASYYVASTDRFDNDTYVFLRKQAAAAIIGFTAMFFMSHFNYKYLKFFAPLLYIISNALLVLVQYFGVELNGEKRWFNVPLVGSVQPSEIAKVGVILFVSQIISSRKAHFKTWREHIAAMFLVAITSALVLWGNLTTAIVVFMIGMGIIFIASPYIARFIMAGIAGGGAVASIIYFGDAFRMERFLAWRNPEAYANGRARQVLQSLYAIGSGGLIGQGPGQSIQKMGPIPEAYNDMIFSVICEEFGFMGALFVLSLFAVLIWRGIRTAINAVDVYGSLTAAGIVVMFAAQVIINVAVVTNTIPATGVPLPFISYGGSSLAISMFCVGILLNISRFSKE